MYKFAAIDIGSNAVRLKVHQVIRNNEKLIKKPLEYIRFPLRLGSDVFDGGYIRPETRVRLGKLLLAFKQLIDLYEVDQYMVCATSALRDSANALEVKGWLEGFTSLNVEVINGDQEAAMVALALLPFIKPQHNYLHIDVGGGSTELNVYRKGKLTSGISFQAGHVRNRTQPVKVWAEMDQWLAENLKDLPEIKGQHQLEAIATGGNIAKLISLYGQLYRPKQKLTFQELLSVYLELAELDPEERVMKLNLNPDRADVIVPSAEIYMHVMRKSRAAHIFAPEVGLADGIMCKLMQDVGLDPAQLSK